MVFLGTKEEKNLFAKELMFTETQPPLLYVDHKRYVLMGVEAAICARESGGFGDRVVGVLEPGPHQLRVVEEFRALEEQR